MPDRESISYHFEEDASPERLKDKSARFFEEGWRKAGDRRQLEIRFPDGRSIVRYSQAFMKCEPRDGRERQVRRCLGREESGRIHWHEFQPCDHWLQVYAEENDLLESLIGFVREGLRNGDPLVLITTAEHRRLLTELLTADGVDMESAAWENRITLVDAEETLAQFMVRGCPDLVRLDAIVMDLLQKVRRPGRKVRAFGEMVALLWERDELSSLMKVEHFWHVLCQREDIAVFCAYPRCGFGPGSKEHLRGICAAHTRVVG